MTTVNELSKNFAPIEENTSTHEINLVSSKTQTLMNAMPLSRMTQSLRAENTENYKNPDFSSVYCFGDGPQNESAYRYSHQMNKRIDSIEEKRNFINQNKVESAAIPAIKEANADSITPIVNKRQKLLDWLKASQAKRDENNRQVFSRWIEKMDNERSAEAGTHVYPCRAPSDMNATSFYCDQLPCPIDLFSAINACPGVANTTPTVYVGFPQTPYPVGNAEFYNCNNIPVSRPIYTQTNKNIYTQGKGDSSYSDVLTDASHNPTGVPHIEEVRSYGNTPNAEGQERSNNSDQNSTESIHQDSTDSVIWPSVISNTSLNYSNPHVMIPMPYVSYMAYNEGQQITQTIPIINSSSETRNSEVCHLPINNLQGNSPLIAPGLNMPIIVGCNSEATVSASHQAQSLTNPQRISNTKYNHYPNMGGYYFQPNMPSASSNRETFFGDNNYPYNNVGSPVISGLNFNMQQWMSILGDIHKVNSKMSCPEQSDKTSKQN